MLENKGIVSITHRVKGGFEQGELSQGTGLILPLCRRAEPPAAGLHL